MTDAEIAELHERYMDEPGPTDVLSFPIDEDDVTEEGVRMLGDVVIAPAVAARNNPADPDGRAPAPASSTGSCTCSGYDHERGR